MTHNNNNFFRTCIQRQLFQSCMNCENMNKDTGVCSTFNERPPISVVLYSCGDNHVFEIPF